MNSCEKAAIICNKSQYNEATFIEKIKLKLHILICDKCLKFSKKNGELTNLCDKAKLKSLSINEKEALKEKLKNIDDKF
ncbi:hypothetical protein KO500_11955 [Cellulophaga baltica]|uniref:hypothetical protein n=1 Tax=Cellulophaga TaxID=104264 RepID=UPI001C07C398|nr:MULTISPECIES: hypothetical protein [Cellulophaga]MBU2997154.1 hypothetical protein [Cellulophaga baltica]MDO6768552.1 hypothetical protein [Cellulophaga sp. 1_MG-2023]